MGWKGRGIRLVGGGGTVTSDGESDESEAALVEIDITADSSVVLGITGRRSRSLCVCSKLQTRVDQSRWSGGREYCKTKRFGGWGGGVHGRLSDQMRSQP